jgi:lactate dehydrogenase-like 2-hydroxyacid dehydrogenase
MPKPVLLLWTDNMDRLIEGALEDRFEIIRLWQCDDPESVIEQRGQDVIATLTVRERFDERLLSRFPNLRLIVVPGAGYEGVDVCAARKRGVTVASAGDTHSADCADHAVALAMARIQRMQEMESWLRDDHWRKVGLPPRRRAMSAERFGIVGLGDIGTAIAKRLVPFGGEIAWWGPRDKPSPWPRQETLLDLARWCTTLFVAARGDAVGLIDATVIDAVGPEGLIVNISRGAVIDEDAMIAALKSGRLGHAALDVVAVEPADPQRWRDVPNTILTPHIGGFTHEAMMRLRAAAIRNLTTALDGGSVVKEILT